MLEAPVLIGVGGASCSGKSSLTKALCKALPEGSATLLTIDSYYHDRSSLSPAEREGLNFDEPHAVDSRLLIDHLKSLAAGDPVRSPVYDFATHSRSVEERMLEPRRFVLVDGLFALYWRELLDLLSFKVFVDAPQSTCLERRLARDEKQRGRTADSVRTQYEETVRPMFHRHVEPTKIHADLVIDGTASRASGLQAVLDLVGGSLPARAAS